MALCSQARFACAEVTDVSARLGKPEANVRSEVDVIVLQLSIHLARSLLDAHGITPQQCVLPAHHGSLEVHNGFVCE